MSEWVKINVDPRTTSTERLLWFAAHLDGFSIKNVVRLREQTKDKVREAHGAEEWKRLGARILIGAQPLQVSAPKTEKGASREFVNAEVYDISQTTLKGRTQAIPAPKRLEAIASVAKKCGYVLKVGKFLSQKPLQVVDEKKEINVNKEYGNQIVFNAAKGFFIMRQREEVAKGWRVQQDNAVTASLAIAAAFEVMVFMGETPAPLPQQAKDILCANPAIYIKDAHNLARRAMRHLAAYRQSYAA